MPKTKLVTLGGDAHLDTSLTPMPGRLQWLASQAEGPEPWQFWPSWDKKKRNQHWNSMEQWHAPLTGWPRISPSNQRGAKGANIQAEKQQQETSTTCKMRLTKALALASLGLAWFGDACSKASLAKQSLATKSRHFLSLVIQPVKNPSSILYI